MNITDIIRNAVEREHRAGTIRVWHAEKRATFEDARTLLARLEEKEL